jgi:hypothetical protein
MGDIARWLQQNLWTGLAAGAAAGFAIAAALTCLAFLLRRPNNIDDEASGLARQERQRLLLLCGDAKALADLAVQRHLPDIAFLEHLRAQPCYAALSPYFSDTFQREITKCPGLQSRSPLLALACRKEIDLLEKSISISSTLTA